MFNTGDLGRWRPDGTLEHLGRVDDQVKIKVRPNPFWFATRTEYRSGFPCRARWRISSHAGEFNVPPLRDVVSHVHQTCPAVHDAVALLIDGELWGFVTPVQADVKAVEEATKKVQPYYAVPTKWYTIDELPHTA